MRRGRRKRKLGSIYKDRLRLTDEEVGRLNRFWNAANNFLKIEGCCIATIRLYQVTVKELNVELKNRQTSFYSEIEKLLSDALGFQQGGEDALRLREIDKTYLMRQIESEIFLQIFNRSENAIRIAFHHRSKSSGDLTFPNQNLINSFEQRIGNLVNQIIQKQVPNIVVHDTITEERLSMQNPDRWKLKLKDLKNNFFKTPLQEFISEVHALANKQDNLIASKIFLEAFKISLDTSRKEALKFYIWHLYYKIQAGVNEKGEMAKTFRKKLFNTENQLSRFERIVSELYHSKDSDKAINEVAKIYLP